MRIAITGGTGFIGRYVIREALAEGHACRCWHRSSPAIFEDSPGDVAWVPGSLTDAASMSTLLAGCDAVIHAALWRPGTRFQGGEGDVARFVEVNVLGTLRLIESARAQGVERFVLLSTCAVHDHILSDRALDESHPLWPNSHYGAHKAALEKFVHSYGLGDGFGICALRPTGVYGLASPPSRSKWAGLVREVVSGNAVACERGGKEVHARDVARAALLLARASSDLIRGQAFNCYDRYVSEFEVATLAQRLSGSPSEIRGVATRPKHEIVTAKLRGLGMVFGGLPLLEATIEELVRCMSGPSGGQ